MEEQIKKKLEDMGIPFDKIEDKYYAYIVYFTEKWPFYIKAFDLSPIGHGEYFAEHNGKFVIPLEFIGDGEHAGKLTGKYLPYFLFDPFPIELIVKDQEGNERICYLEYRRSPIADSRER